MSMKDNPFQDSRRKFFGQASCAAVGSSTLLSTLFNLKGINASVGFNSSINNNPNDYKALVCVLLGGGNDAFNMLMPRTGAAYTEYANTRTNQAIPQNQIRAINPIISDGKEYGVHPSMIHMQSMFEDGKLAFISNIGTLVQPITKQQFYAGTIPTPIGLYSHIDQVTHWQTGIPSARQAQGWGGKMADLLVASNENQNISMSISTSGGNVFQSGNNSVEFSINPLAGEIGINGYNDDWEIMEYRRQAFDAMMNPDYQNIFKKAYTETNKKAINGAEILRPIRANTPTWTTPFVPYLMDRFGPITKNFHEIANLIAGRDQIDMKRQIFFVEFGGFDMHDELLTDHSERLIELDRALHSFNQAMIQLGLQDSVTTFSLSEFSRTLTSNGNGTDHAWGANTFVMGGAVNGKKMYGDYPSLSLGNSNPLEIGGGSLIPTTATDVYFAELALWFGVPASDLALLFPNIGTFYDTTSGNNPLGFMNLV